MKIQETSNLPHGSVYGNLIGFAVTSTASVEKIGCLLVGSSLLVEYDAIVLTKH